MRAVKRAFSILKILADETRNGSLSLTEVSDKARLDSSTCFRFLSSLEEIGVVRKDDTTRGYELGPRLLFYADSLLKNLGLEQRVKPFLQSVVSITKETAFYSVRNGDYRATLYFVESPYETITRVAVGIPQPLTSGCSGRATLAFLSDEETRRILRKYPVDPVTPWTISDPAEIKKKISEARSKGYAISIRERVSGTNAVAAPVFNNNGVIGSIAIVGPAERLTKKACEKYSSVLKEAARELSGEMGVWTSTEGTYDRKTLGPRIKRNPG